MWTIDDLAHGQLSYEEEDQLIGIDVKTQILAGLTLFEFSHNLDSGIGSIPWADSLLNAENQELSQLNFDLHVRNPDYKYLAQPNDFNRNFMLYFGDFLPSVEAYANATANFLKNSSAAVNFAENLLWILIQSYNPVLVAPGRRSSRVSDDHVTFDNFDVEDSEFKFRFSLDENKTAKSKI